MVQRILAREGIPGFYRGFLPNALKNLPNKGARPGIFLHVELQTLGPGIVALPAAGKWQPECTWVEHVPGRSAEVSR